MMNNLLQQPDAESLCQLPKEELQLVAGFKFWDKLSVTLCPSGSQPIAALNGSSRFGLIRDRSDTASSSHLESNSHTTDPGTVQ